MELNCTIQVAIDINRTYCWISCLNVYHADFMTPTIGAVMINCIRTTDIIWLPSRHEKHFHLWNTPMWEIQAASHLCFKTALNIIILLLSDWIKSDWLNPKHFHTCFSKMLLISFEDKGTWCCWLHIFVHGSLFCCSFSPIIKCLSTVWKNPTKSDTSIFYK